ARRPAQGLRSIIFSPDETWLLRDAPAARRAYLDDVIRACEPSFGALLRDYERTLAQRNRFLIDKTLVRSEIVQQLPHWDDGLLSWGSRISLLRSVWIEKLAVHLPQLYAGFAPSDSAARLSYLPFYGSESFSTEAKIAERFAELLLQRRDEEIERRITLVGPHRDDWEIGLGEGKARRHASQGQHRTLVLSLKLAELKLREEETHDRPVLLLDDVTSELDEQRLQRLLDHLCEIKAQTFLTTTERGVFPDRVLKAATTLLFSLPQLTVAGTSSTGKAASMRG
ncbi:MAG: DNA replication and repair protein RecF, partial [Deltaproteobacteria bacterium]|nr:DNA replication and repair protein RecF [Deltaproteobacteria bacterium]